MTNFLIVPINCDKNIFKIGVALYYAALQRKKDVLYSRVIQSKSLSKAEITLEKLLGIDNSTAIRLSEIDHAFATGAINDFSEKIAETYYSKPITQHEIIIAEGVAPDNERAYLFGHNRSIAAILKAQVILVVDAKGKSEQRVMDLIKTFHDLSFEKDTLKLGYILINIEGSVTSYVHKVGELILKAKVDLACILAIDYDLTELNDEKELADVAKKIDFSCLENTLKMPFDKRMAPSVYRRAVIKKSSEVNKRIVLPEGAEPRTIQAAIICHQKKIARCVLLTSKAELANTLNDLGLTLPDDIEVLDPAAIRKNYVDALVAIRKKKGLTNKQAESLLADNVYLGTMMLENGEVDGLVSGAIHTTANTIRPALQIIKMDATSSIVSSVFFMLMPNEVYVFGDCAVNTDITAMQMAEIAIQSYDSAISFGIDPKVAMISYSTKDSGAGPSVDKVNQATTIVKAKRPDILIDGPLQYDAACDPGVAAKKAPDSLVAGQANVFIFPDLNTGNSVYKAVQRTGNILSVGPMLQGLNKAVNDLSRGASIEDIVFTIAITAIQAVQKARKS